MRVALVSPYSWTYPGGVNRHIEALAGELLARGHDVRVFAPWDADRRRAALLHRGARPQVLEPPPWLVALGGTAGWPFNGAVSNLAMHPTGVTRLRRELRAFAPDVVHLQEPVAPTPGWDTLMTARAPLVGTFHTYSTSLAPHAFAIAGGARRRLDRLAVRIAVSEAAAWTGRRFYGGTYRVVPNGVTLPAAPAVPRERAPGEPLRVLFVGQAVERKGLPVLLRAFEDARDHVPLALTVVGADPADVHPLLDDPEGVDVLGRVDDARKVQALAAADLLVAPSLHGESFGMVLTEAFAHATPVVASRIVGYREVVTDGHDGVLVPPGDPAALAGALRELAEDPVRLAGLGAGAAGSARRYAWPRVAEEVEQAYTDAVAIHATGGARRVPAQRVPPPEPARTDRVRRRRKVVRPLLVGAAAASVAAGAVYGLHRIGADAVGRALVASSPVWVLAALAAMCASMVLRAGAWTAILRGALPGAGARFRDAWQGTAIGVLMSATLPARLGEPARALIVARRLGRARERLPAVVGTLVAQTVLNVVALVALGSVLLHQVETFAGSAGALAWWAGVPLAVAVVVLLIPGRHRARVRSGLSAFARPRLAATAVAGQLGAWALQWLSCYLLLVALGLEDHAGLAAAAAVLFAVNVSAAVPVTPSNLGVFQAACVAVLTGAYGVRSGDALAYGIVLQCVEVATAVVMGAPALVREGLSWRDVRLRTLNAATIAPPRRPVPDRGPVPDPPG